MDRDHLEALLWQHWPTRGTLAERSVEAILRAADAYAASAVIESAQRRKRRQPRQWLLPEQWRVRPPGRPVLRHATDTDLYPVIGALAEALLCSTGTPALDADGQPPYEVRREYLESA